MCSCLRQVLQAVTRFSLAHAGMNVLSVFCVLSMLVRFMFVGVQSIAFIMLSCLFSCYCYILSECCYVSESRRECAPVYDRLHAVTCFALAHADINK